MADTYHNTVLCILLTQKSALGWLEHSEQFAQDHSGTTVLQDNGACRLVMTIEQGFHL